MSEQHGLLVVLEGPEGCGKSTIARSLEEALRQAGKDTLLTREPGGTLLGEHVRGILLGEADIPPEAELLLMCASRAAVVRDVLRPALRAGKVVVLDRYRLSSYAYQGVGRQLPLEDVVRVSGFAEAGLTPDITLVLDAPDSTLDQRLAGRFQSVSPDRIEREKRDFHARVRTAYRSAPDLEPTAVIIDADRSREEVVATALEHVLTLLRERRQAPRRRQSGIAN